MPKTAVGLFKNPNPVAKVISEIERLGIPRREVRTLEEPLNFEVAGVMSFPRLDFEVQLNEELIRIGATETQARAFLDGVRTGGTLVTATGNDQKVDAATDVMNRYGAVEIEEGSGPEPHLPRTAHKGLSTERGDSVMAGRLRHSGGGACFFVW